MRCGVSTVALAALILFPVASLAKTKIGDLECGPGEIAKSDGTGWVCSDDLDALSQAIEEVGGFGCSAYQQGNSVLITCGDGTAGVIAGAGTVVIYPEGQIGQVPPIDYNTGPIVLVDGSGVILGKASSVFTPDWFGIYLDPEGRLVGMFVNERSTQQLLFSADSGQLWFLSDDCSGPAFALNGQPGPWQVGDRFFAGGPGPSARLVFGSMYVTGRWNQAPSECKTEPRIDTGIPVVEYFLAPEIVNAVYPVRLEQLP